MIIVCFVRLFDAYDLIKDNDVKKITNHYNYCRVNDKPQYKIINKISLYTLAQLK